MDAYINTAVKVARQAGVMLLRQANHLSGLHVEHKSFNDYVTQADKTSEAILVDGLLRAFPNHKIHTEESGIHGDKNSHYEWIIDPLDGTTNYLHHHSQYAISIALKVKNQLQEAVIYSPEKNDLYTATRGQGAYLNGRRLRVSKRQNLEESLIATGFPVVDHSIVDLYLMVLKKVMAHTAGARREGAASLDLCAVASGLYEGFFEFNLKPWDIAAGALIVSEAGGLVTDMEGENTWLDTGNIVAGNPKAVAALLRFIKDARNSRYA